MRTYYLTHTHSVNEHQKTCQNKGSKILFNFSFFHLYTHRARKFCSYCWHYIFFASVFSCFFFVSMKDSHSHLTKLWAWLKAVRTTEFSKKLIVCKTQKLPNAPDITSLEDGKIRFQSEEKEFYCLECFLKLWHIFLSGKTEYFKCTEFFQI